jgi:hypothetical protein
MCSVSHINQDAASSISLHHHHGDNTLQLRGIHASEQPAQNHSTASAIKKKRGQSLHIENVPVYGGRLDVGILLHP